MATIEMYDEDTAQGSARGPINAAYFDLLIAADTLRQQQVDQDDLPDDVAVALHLTRLSRNSPDDEQLRAAAGVFLQEMDVSTDEIARAARLKHPHAAHSLGFLARLGHRMAGKNAKTGLLEADRHTIRSRLLSDLRLRPGILMTWVDVPDDGK